MLPDIKYIIWDVQSGIKPVLKDHSMATKCGLSRQVVFGDQNNYTNEGPSFRNKYSFKMSLMAVVSQDTIVLTIIRNATVVPAF